MVPESSFYNGRIGVVTSYSKSSGITAWFGTVIVQTAISWEFSLRLSATGFLRNESRRSNFLTVFV